MHVPESITVTSQPADEFDAVSETSFTLETVVRLPRARFWHERSKASCANCFALDTAVDRSGRNFASPVAEPGYVLRLAVAPAAPVSASISKTVAAVDRISTCLSALSYPGVRSRSFGRSPRELTARCGLRRGSILKPAGLTGCSRY